MRKAPLLLGVVLILAACGSRTAETTSTTTTPVTSTTEPPTTTAAPTTTTTEGTTTTLDPERWSTGEIRGYRWEERFSAARTEGLAFTTYGFLVVEVGVSGTGRAPMLRSDQDPAHWVTMLDELEFVEVGDVAEVEVGGKPASTLSLELPVGATESDGGGSCAVPCVILFDSPGYGWYVGEGFPQRIWIIERDRGSFVLFAEADRADKEEAMFSTIEEWVSTIEWG